MVNVKRAAEIMGRLGAMRFFPSDPNAQAAILQIACEMARSETQLEWLADRMLSLYNDWPGPMEMRACFCSKFQPKDGIERHSSVFPDGIKSESEATNRLILGPNHAQGLIEGNQEPRTPQQISADTKTEIAMRASALAVGLKSLPFNAPVSDAEIAAAPEWLRRLEGYTE